MAETQTDREPGTGIRSLDGAETVTRVLHATITITMIVTIFFVTTAKFVINCSQTAHAYELLPSSVLAGPHHAKACLMIDRNE